MLALQAIDQASSWQVIAIALVGELLALVFVYRILVRGASPASTLLWIVVIVATPWIGLGLYYLLPRHLHLRRLRRLRVRGEAASVLATIEQRRRDFRRLSEADLPSNPLWRAVDGVCGILSPPL